MASAANDAAAAGSPAGAGGTGRCNQEWWEGGSQGATNTNSEWQQGPQQKYQDVWQSPQGQTEQNMMAEMYRQGYLLAMRHAFAQAGQLGPVVPQAGAQPACSDWGWQTQQGQKHDSSQGHGQGDRTQHVPQQQAHGAWQGGGGNCQHQSQLQHEKREEEEHVGANQHVHQQDKGDWQRHGEEGANQHVFGKDPAWQQHPQKDQPWQPQVAEVEKEWNVQPQHQNYGWEGEHCQHGPGSGPASNQAGLGPSAYPKEEQEADQGQRDSSKEKWAGDDWHEMQGNQYDLPYEHRWRSVWSGPVTSIQPWEKKFRCAGIIPRVGKNWWNAQCSDPHYVHRGKVYQPPAYVLSSMGSPQYNQVLIPVPVPDLPLTAHAMYVPPTPPKAVTKEEADAGDDMEDVLEEEYSPTHDGQWWNSSWDDWHANEDQQQRKNTDEQQAQHEEGKPIQSKSMPYPPKTPPPQKQLNQQIPLQNPLEQTPIHQGKPPSPPPKLQEEIPPPMPSPPQTMAPRSPDKPPARGSKAAQVGGKGVEKGKPAASNVSKRSREKSLEKKPKEKKVGAQAEPGSIKKKDRTDKAEKLKPEKSDKEKSDKAAKQKEKKRDRDRSRSSRKKKSCSGSPSCS